MRRIRGPNRNIPANKSRYEGLFCNLIILSPFLTYDRCIDIDALDLSRASDVIVLFLQHQCWLRDRGLRSWRDWFPWTNWIDKTHILFFFFVETLSRIFLIIRGTADIHPRILVFVPSEVSSDEYRNIRCSTEGRLDSRVHRAIVVFIWEINSFFRVAVMSISEIKANDTIWVSELLARN